MAQCILGRQKADKINECFSNSPVAIQFSLRKIAAISPAMESPNAVTYLVFPKIKGISGVPRVSGARGEDGNWRPPSACQTGMRRRRSPSLFGGLGQSPSRQL